MRNDIIDRASLEQIADQMALEPSVCTIVNLRRHARKLFNELKDRCESDEEVFLLTTDLCPGTSFGGCRRNKRTIEIRTAKTM